MQNYKHKLQTHNETHPKKNLWIVLYLPDPLCLVLTMVQMD